MTHQDELATLRSECARLAALLDAHGITWRLPPEPLLQSTTEPSRLTTDKKVALFRKLFRGRMDVYPIRWEGKTSGKSGYAPACANEWRAGICEKPRIKCGDCTHRVLLPLTDTVIYKHLAGGHTVGVYPLLEGDTCHFLAVDFDEAEWRDDAGAFIQSCSELGVSAALEVSRSGQGAHVWIFFADAVSARDARRLGTAIISHTCARTRQLKLTSYDRLFPNQDTMPKGGFGNLIALPLQKKPREEGFSVFVDADLRLYPDQWAFLASIATMPAHDIEPTILRATSGAHPLDVTFIDDEDLATPWKWHSAPVERLVGDMPSALTVTLANQVYFEKGQLPQTLANRLIRLAAFQNPEFYRAQAMRMSVWDKPRVIGCAENYPQHIAIPRGCFDAAAELLADNGVRLDLCDERHVGELLAIDLVGTLRPDQQAAVAAMLRHDAGVLCAPTAFGKTVTAAAMIAQRGVNTLVLVHRTELLKQWQERLAAFLGVGKGVIGVIGGGKARTAAIARAITDAFQQSRKVLVLTERTEHIDAIRAALADEIPKPFVLHGQMSKKQRATVIAALNALPPNSPRVLLATGKLVGEGFDHPPLDTLVLAMPVSWKGTLQQYAGRLHREHASKTDVRIIDFVDTGHPALLRMWDKRQRGYRVMGYRIESRQ